MTNSVVGMECGEDDKGEEEIMAQSSSHSSPITDAI